MKIDIKELSVLPEQACCNAILKSGLNLPDVYKDQADTPALVKSIVDNYEKGYITPGAIPYGYTELVKLCEEVFKVTEVTNKALSANDYILQNSDPIGEWQDNYSSYNCYRFATIDKLRDYDRCVNPGDYVAKKIRPITTLEAMCELVRTDLKALQYDDIEISNNSNLIQQTITRYAMCFRLSDDKKDYHFVKREIVKGEVVYQHKPGTFWPLQWKSEQFNKAVPWSTEFVTSNGDAHSGSGGNSCYTGEIMYVAYNS